MDKKVEDPDPNELVPMNFRAPRWLARALEEWVTEMNQAPRWPKMSRPDLIRGLLEWALNTRPEWEKGLAELQGHTRGR